LQGWRLNHDVMDTPRFSLMTRIIRRFIIWYYRQQGWTEINSVPEIRRCVVIAVPHTSNWDFVFIMGAKQALNIPLSFVGKATLFRWPFGRMMREMGGISVDRTRSTNFVDAMIAEFGRRDDFMLTIAPEGTRGKVKKWKTGFYHIAVGAKVPLVIGMMDYAKKQVGLVKVIWPTGDYVKDMAQVSEYYRTVTPRHPSGGTPDFGTGE
jgi:1-acyl-sn-glycerol-3-phosphate acyltransferase